MWVSNLNLVYFYLYLVFAYLYLVYVYRQFGFLTEFHNVFRASRPTDDLFRVVVDKIAWVFNVYGATRAVEFDIWAEAYLDPC